MSLRFKFLSEQNWSAEEAHTHHTRGSSLVSNDCQTTKGYSPTQSQPSYLFRNSLEVRRAPGRQFDILPIQLLLNWGTVKSTMFLGSGYRFKMQCNKRPLLRRGKSSRLLQLASVLSDLFPRSLSCCSPSPALGHTSRPEFCML